MKPALQPKIKQCFLRFYEEYGIRSNSLMKALLELYGKHENQYGGSYEFGSFDEFLAKLLLSDDAKLANILSFSVRDQKKNHSAICTAAALVKLFEDMKPFALNSVLSGQFDLAESYGINPLPLYNHFPQSLSQDYIRTFFPNGINDAALTELFQNIKKCILQIKNEKLLGKNTEARFSYLRFWADIKIRDLAEINYQGISSLLRINQVLRKTISLLADRWARQYPPEKTEKIKNLLIEIIILYFRCNILILYKKYPQVKTYNMFMFMSVLSDEIISLIRGLHQELNKKHPNLQILLNKVLVNFARTNQTDGLTTEYCPYTQNYIYSGDYFGDCTANIVKKQVDPNTANIHWTVYSWLLNPYYRIIEVYYGHNGTKEKLLKGHIMPVVIHDRKVLMIDAIEVVPKLRRFVRGRENEYFDQQLFDSISGDLLQALFEKCEELAEMMGVEAIYVEMYSNARWVNRKLSQLPSDSYNIFNDVCIPFGTGVIEKNIELLQNDYPRNVVFEVQAVNCNLMEQYTKVNYKEIAVLKGRREFWNLKIRGI